LRLPLFVAICQGNRKSVQQMWFRQQTASWQDFTVLTGRMASGEQALRRKFWRKLLSEAAKLPFAEELLTAHYCAFDRHTPLYVKALLVTAIAYFVVPDHLIPKRIPIIGYADDAAVLAAAFKAVSSHIRAEHREAARRVVARLRSAAPSRP
jgi:uncharacterized membrane protein YkvA (DUF1232 family)